MSIAGFSEALRRYQAAVEDWDRLIAHSLGINQTDARCLEVLLFEHPDGATPAALGAALALTSGSVTTMVDRLMRAGLVMRRRHPNDQRSVLVMPTEQAKTNALGLHQPLIDRGRSLLARYAAQDIERMTDFFIRATELQREVETELRHGLRVVPPSDSST